jgi:hypothetical protein
MEWTLFMMKIWMKYPVKYLKQDDGAILVPGTPGRFSPNSQENKTFREIETYIARDMSNAQTKTIVPMWATGTGSTHQQFMIVPLSDRTDIPDTLKKDAILAADVPDTWCTGSPVPYCQQINHGFVPTLITPVEIDGIGKAPDNFGIYTTTAKQDFTAGDYQGSFTNMGYASHFISDLGQPFHTPNAQLIPLQFIDSPFSEIIFPNSEMIVNYEVLHNKYEDMVANNFDMFYTGNTDRYNIDDPTYSAKVQGVNSWALNYPLVYACYWEFVKNSTNTDYLDNPLIVSITKNRVSETMKWNRGLVQYVTGGQYPVLSTDWIWSRDGWSDWQHTFSYSGTEVGSNTEYGPVMVDDHGEHGTETNLLGGSTQSSVWKTFTDPSGSGWNTVEFSGLMSASDVPGGRWITMDINGQQVFGGTASDNPPGNGVPFTIKETFPQSSTVTVKISSGQNPAWGPRFLMKFYSVKLSNENTLTVMAKSGDTSFVIPDGSEFTGNVTAPGNP